MSALRIIKHIATIVGALGVLLALAATASAQVLSVDAPDTWSPSNDTALSVNIAYTLPPGQHPSVVIELPWPDPIVPGSVAPTFVTSAYAGTFTFSSTLVSGVTYYRWTATNLTVPSTGTSGAIVVSARILQFGAVNGTIYTWHPTMKGSLVATAAPDTTTAIPAAHLQYYDAQMSSTNWVVADNSLGNGLLVRYDFRVQNDGNAQILAGTTLAVTLGAKLYFVRTFARNGNEGTIPDPPHTSLTLGTNPPAWTRPAVGEPAYTVTATAVDTIGDVPGGGIDYSPHFHVDVFIPCQYIGPNLHLDDPDFGVTAVTVGYERQASGPDIARTAVQWPTFTSPAVANAPLHATGYACGTGGGLSKNWDGETRGVDTNLEWYIFVDPPKAVLPFQKAMIVDPLPPGIVDATLTMVPAHTPATDDRPGFVGYFCAFSSTDLTTLNVDTFTTLAATRCASTWSSTTTHAVFWAPEGWGSNTFGIDITDFRVFTRIPPDWLVGNRSPIRNFAWFEGRANGVYYGGPDTAPENQWGDDAWRNMDDRSVPFVQDYNYAMDFDNNPANGRQEPPRTLARGQGSRAAFRIYIDDRRTPAWNPRLEITPPPGVVIDSATTGFYAAGCDPGMEAATTPPGAPLTGPLVWQFGDDDTPYKLRYYCAWAIVDFTAPTSYPFVNGQNLPFLGVITADNSEAPASVTLSFQVTVPPEMRVNLDGSCWNDDGTPGRPGFRVTALNTGGVDLHHILTTFDVPSGATYGGIDPITDNVPAGAVFEIASDGGAWTQTTPGDAANAAIRHVRLRSFDIAAGIGALPVRYKVRLQSASPAGASIIGSAVMAADELPPTPLTTKELVLGTCPSDVTLIKFFDADGDGEELGSSETRLPGWAFSLHRGTTTLRAVTATSGAATFLDVPAGTWAFSEAAPSGLGGLSTWAQTTGVQSIAVPGDGAPIEIAIGNRCSCNVDLDGDECTTPGCDASGACTTPEGPAQDGLACGDDACAVSACAGGVCVPTEVLDCRDTSDCTVDSCDPEEGCMHVRPSCDVVAFYASVSDGTKSGRVHCTVAPGQAPLCDTEADGRTLAITWNAPDMCGGYSPPAK